MAESSKLPPLLKFHWETNGLKEQTLRKNKYVLKGDIFVKCQPNAWIDHDIWLTIYCFYYLI